MSNVVSLNGCIHDGKEAIEACVKSLEWLLEAARSGEIVGVAVAALHHDDTAHFEFGGVTDSYKLIGALETAKVALAIRSMGDDE